MFARFLRSISLLALLTLMFAACSKKEAAEYTDYDGTYEDAAPLSPSSSSSSSRAKVVPESSGKRTAAVAEKAGTSASVSALTTSTESMTVGAVSLAEGVVPTAAGEMGVRGGRASEAAMRVDAIETTDAVGFVGDGDGIATVDIAHASITTPKLADGSVTSPKIADDAVLSVKVPEGTVAGEEVARYDDLIIADDITEEAADRIDAIDEFADVDEVEVDEEEVKEMEAEETKVEAAPQFGQLTAGEWNDLSEWNFWNSVNASKDWKHMKDYWGLGNGQRISIRVDNGHEPICDAVAQLFDKDGKLLWTAHSDNFGRAELFTGLKQSEGEAPYSIVVNSAGKETRMGGIDPSREQSPSEGPLVVRVGGEVPKRKVVDLMFMVDATGSMGDELNYVKAELQNVIDRVRSEMGEAYEIRLSTNVYRDHGDEYVVRSQEFSTDIDKAAEFLQDQIANGGGDTPEAVVDALSDAVREHEWSGSAQSRFLFMVLDAPPHYSEEELAEIRTLTSEASAKGIKIIGVSGSGVDKETEFLMRELGIHTGGTYVFLTDNSGIGGSHIEPTVGSYAVEYLNDLLVRLIVQYTERPESLDAITPRKPELH